MPVKDALDARADGRDVSGWVRRPCRWLPDGHDGGRGACEEDCRQCLFHADRIAMPSRPGNDEYASGARADADGRVSARASAFVAHTSSSVRDALHSEISSLYVFPAY